MRIEKSITRLLQRRNLTETEAYGVFGDLFDQKLTMPEAKALLLLLAEKGETVDEVRGCLNALRKREPVLRAPAGGVMDTCGTGGDGSHSINVSTLAAFVIAGAGGKVAKHGNRAVSSKSGSSDLMESFGIKLDAKPRRMIESISRNGIGYFHAPFYHPVFSKVQPLRKALGVRTIFNLLGPLVNPVKIRYQLVGVAKREFLDLYARIPVRPGNGLTEGPHIISRQMFDGPFHAVHGKSPFKLLQIFFLTCNDIVEYHPCPITCASNA